MSILRVAELPPGGTAVVRVPILGQALCAGFPSPADDFLDGSLELPRWLVPNPPATFLWQIQGESMRGAGIFDRDLACVDRSLTAGHDSVVVAAVDGQMSIKRLVAGQLAEATEILQAQVEALVAAGCNGLHRDPSGARLSRRNVAHEAGGRDRCARPCLRARLQDKRSIRDCLRGLISIRLVGRVLTTLRRSPRHALYPHSEASRRKFTRTDRNRCLTRQPPSGPSKGLLKVASSRSKLRQLHLLVPRQQDRGARLGDLPIVVE